MAQRTSQRHGAMDAARPRPAMAAAGSQPAPFRLQLTTRGALLGLFALNLLTFLVAAWLHANVLAGIGYCAGAVLAPFYLRRDAQLQVAVSVPAVALIAVVLSQAVTAQGSSSHGTVMSVLEGTLLTLTGLAPWLFAGTAASIAVACFRGLPRCVRDLRDSLHFEDTGSVRATDRTGYGSPLS
jgi:hypothetical protein